MRLYRTYTSAAILGQNYSFRFEKCISEFKEL